MAALKWQKHRNGKTFVTFRFADRYDRDGVIALLCWYGVKHYDADSAGEWRDMSKTQATAAIRQEASVHHGDDLHLWKAEVYEIFDDERKLIEEWAERQLTEMEKPDDRTVKPRE